MTTLVIRVSGKGSPLSGTFYREKLDFVLFKVPRSEVSTEVKKDWSGEGDGDGVGG